MIWIAPGLAHGDTYDCKQCQLSFIVRELPPETLNLSAKGCSSEKDFPDGVTNEKDRLS